MYCKVTELNVCKYYLEPNFCTFNCKDAKHCDHATMDSPNLDRSGRAAGYVDKVSDTDRIDWLEKIVSEGACPALVNDDAGHWAVVFDGMQDLPLDAPQDINTTFFIEKKQWKKTVREAIDCAMVEEAKST